MRWTIAQGDALAHLAELPDESVHTVVTSPPYFGLRDYDVQPTDWPTVSYEMPGGTIEIPAATCCLGQEETVYSYVGHLVAVCRELHRALRADGTFWLNLGDSYASHGGQRADGKGPGLGGTPQHMRGQIKGHRVTPCGYKQKDLLGVPWLVAFALRADGWWVRSEIIWSKANPMPESVTDRVTRGHEQLFHLAKSGDATYWTHPDGRGARERPDPDFVWMDRLTGERTAEEPPVGWEAETYDEKGQHRRRWARSNMWEGHDYYYDNDAIREPHTMRPQARPNGHKRRRPGPDIPEHTWSGTRRDTAGIDGNPAGRNKRSVWALTTRPFKPPAGFEDTPPHFAVFPPDLITPCVLAGSSPKACGACGAPWQRIVEIVGQSTTEIHRELGSSGYNEAYEQAGHSSQSLNHSGFRHDDRPERERHTLGWQPTCEHADSTGRTVVLDPFAGTGTTGVVAAAHDRDFVGIELSPHFAEMARARIRDDSPLFNASAEIPPDDPLQPIAPQQYSLLEQDAA